MFLAFVHLFPSEYLPDHSFELERVGSSDPAVIPCHYLGRTAEELVTSYVKSESDCHHHTKSV